MTDGVETVGNDRRGPDMPSSVIPDTPSVIPDVSNRESRVFPKQGYTNEGREKETGFPLETCGNDRRGGNHAGMTGEDPTCPPRSFLTPPRSFPTLVIGNPGFFPSRDT